MHCLRVCLAILLSGFGRSVSIDGDRLLVGAYRAAYLYRQDSDGWTYGNFDALILQLKMKLFPGWCSGLAIRPLPPEDDPVGDGKPGPVVSPVR